MTNHVETVRKAAEDLKKAIDAAKKDGFYVTWPVNANGLGEVVVSETGKSNASVTVTVSPDVSPELAEKAQRAGQAAVEKTIGKELDKETKPDNKS